MNLPDEELLRLWRSVAGPNAELTGPLIRYAGLVYAARLEFTGWLVALGSSPPRWWTGRGDDWTDSVDGTRAEPARCAIRFARREDAERAIGWLIDQKTARGCRAEEHLWLDSVRS